MASGAFHNFALPYELNGKAISYDDQATKLLDVCRTLLGNGCKGVGYIYSANYGQTRMILQTYFSGGWDTKTTGVHQAQTVMAVEDQLGKTYSDLQGKVHILAITTMNAYDHPITGWNTDIQLGILNTDLDRIEYYLESGWDVLGLQDQHTSAQKPYAIGGTVANMPQTNSDYIQQRLIALSTAYPGSTL